MILLICLDISFITASILRGKFRASASAELFLNSVVSTYVASILLTTFVTEPLKIIFIACYYAVRDKVLISYICTRLIAP